jgi:putative ABC transport system permease protein
MAVLVMVFRKMFQNKLLVFCHLLGLVFSIALISCVPMYTDGILQKLIVKEIEQAQQLKRQFGGSYLIYMEFFASVPYTEREEKYSQIDEYIKENTDKLIGMPLLAEVKSGKSVEYPIIEEKLVTGKLDRGRRALIQAVTDMEDHINLTAGRMPSKDVKDGIYEVMVTETAINRLDLVLDKVYLMTEPGSNKMRDILIKPVAIFEPEDSSDAWWYQDAGGFHSSLFIHYELFSQDFVHSDQPLFRSIEWYYAFDYTKITLRDIRRFISSREKFEMFAQEIHKDIQVDVPAVEILEKYVDDEEILRLILWALSLPAVLLLVFYICMVSALIVESEKNEISIMQSRGASRMQIIFLYLIQGLVLAAAALAAGPFLGLLLTRLLGSSSGFMAFVKRKALQINLSAEVYRYSLAAVAASVIMLLYPANHAAGTSIVLHKQQSARKEKLPVWSRVYLDGILIGLSCFGLYLFQQRQQILSITGADAKDINMDSFLFCSSTLFILGCGLLFLRLYPWMIMLVYRLGKRWWKPDAYAALIKVSRANREYHIVMLFLILTVATGFFSANAARTMNRNMEEKIYYAIGADVTLMPSWENDAPVVTPMGGIGTQSIESSYVQYEEPPFEPYTELTGVNHAAKVFRKNGARVRANKHSLSGVTLIAIEPYDFSKVLWFRNDLLPHHINSYLNLLNIDPSAVLLSSSFAREFGIQLGDTISLSWGELSEASFFVSGFVDYWPSWNPNRIASSETLREPLAVIANLLYVQNQLKLEPYEIWLDVDDDITSAVLYKDIRNKGVTASNIRDARQEVIKERNDPIRLAVNGILTLGFLISILITFIGFLIYWLLALNRRGMEFGVLRAMGSPLHQVILMIGWELILTSVLAIVMGFVIGAATSGLFIPLFQFSSSAAEQVPPFRVIYLREDRRKLIFVVVTMLISGLIILGRKLSTLKISQAIKIGED